MAGANPHKPDRALRTVTPNAEAHAKYNEVYKRYRTLADALVKLKVEG
jgi:hypothetical protein